MTRIRGRARKGKATGGFVDLATYSRATLATGPRTGPKKRKPKEIKK